MADATILACHLETHCNNLTFEYNARLRMSNGGSPANATSKDSVPGLLVTRSAIVTTVSGK